MKTNFLGRLSILIGAIAAGVVIYTAWTDYQQNDAPHASVNIAGNWVTSDNRLHYNFTHTRGEHYIWKLKNTTESDKAVINPNGTITATIHGKPYIFKVTNIDTRNNCARTIMDQDNRFILNRVGHCK